MFYCKARRKRLEQKEFKGKHKTLLSEKKIKIKTTPKGELSGWIAAIVYLDTEETTFRAVSNYCILNPFASNILFDELKRVMSKATFNVGIGLDIKCAVYYF